jgi:hypothetical protein
LTPAGVLVVSTLSSHLATSLSRTGAPLRLAMTMRAKSAAFISWRLAWMRQHLARAVEHAHRRCWRWPP